MCCVIRKFEPYPMWCGICVILHQSVNSHSLLFIFFRALITMTVSSVWHGVYVGYYLCLMSAPMYLPVEDVYVKIRKGTTGLVCVIVPYLLHKFDKSKRSSRNELDVHSLVSAGNYARRLENPSC